jgi:hypothetical protein
VKYTVTGGVYIFYFYSSGTYSPNGNSQLDHNASIDADFLKEVPFGVSRFAKKFQGSYLPSKIKKYFLTASEAWKS